MHERTQRAVARLMFVFCCAVPTALTLVCVLLTWTPWYHQRALSQLETELSTACGLVVEIDDFSRPTPTSWQLEQVLLSDPETMREVARVRRVQWNRDAQQQSLLLHQPELRSSQLALAWQLVHDRFLCRPDRTSLPTQVAGNDLTIHSSSGALTMRDIDAWIRTSDGAVEATLQCVPAHLSSRTPVHVTIRRDRATDTPNTKWLLDTGGTALPCSALAEYLPLMRGLGSEATFLGTMAWQWKLDGWSLDLGGARFEQVSIDGLFEQHAHRLSGTATIQLERCRIEPHNRRSDIAGSIRIANGLIGRSLLASASEHLGFEVRLPEALRDASGDIPFDRIAIGFNINNTQMTLRGICRNEPGFEIYPADVVMLLSGLPLVQSHDQTLSAISLLAAVAPNHSVPVPVSQQTRVMMNVLIPPSRGLPKDAALPARLQSTELKQGGPTVAQP